MSAADYEKQKYLAGMEAARRCMSQLREHFESITLNLAFVDNAGVEVTVELEWSEDDDDDDEDEKGTKC